jgi:hypothetical protein
VNEKPKERAQHNQNVSLYNESEYLCYLEFPIEGVSLLFGLLIIHNEVPINIEAHSGNEKDGLQGTDDHTIAGDTLLL